QGDGALRREHRRFAAAISRAVPRAALYGRVAQAMDGAHPARIGAGASRPRPRIARGSAQGEAADHPTARPFSGSQTLSLDQRRGSRMANIIDACGVASLTQNRFAGEVKAKNTSPMLVYAPQDGADMRIGRGEIVSHLYLVEERDFLNHRPRVLCPAVHGDKHRVHNRWSSCLNVMQIVSHLSPVARTKSCRLEEDD